MLKYVEKYKGIDLYVDHSVTKETVNVDESLLVNELDNELFIGNEILGDNDEDVIEDVSEDKGQSSRNESMNVEDDRDDGSNSDDGSASDDDSDSQDSDFFVDPDNMIDDVDVDMAEFRSNIDANVEWVGSKAIVTTEEEEFEEEEVNHDELDSGSDSEYEGERKKALKMYHKINKANAFNAESGGTTWKENFYVGLKFSNRKEIKEIVTRVVVEQRRELHLKKNDKETWAVKTLKDTHKCLQSRIVKKCTASFLSKSVEESIKPNPKIPLNSLKDQLQKQYEVGISKQKVFRAKKMAQERVEDGFKAGKRDLLRLDECFLSGSYPRWILTAVGVDLNNGIYPLAYAIVESETKIHESGRAHCDVLLNNMCEVFNKQLVDGRDKPIITCLEFIREYSIIRIVNVQKVMIKSDGHLTQNATKVFNKIVKEAGQMKIDWNGGDLYQATTPWGDQPPKKRKKSAAELAEGMVKGNKLSKAAHSLNATNLVLLAQNVGT
nr:hypothetical protein [Tanacetum cinerariifolium]